MTSKLSMPMLRLILGQVCVHACMAGVRMASPLLALRQGYSPMAVGVLLSLFALTQVFLALPAGRYADRQGLRRPVAVAVVAACLGSGLACLFPRYPVLCLAALLTGGATGVASIALQRHVGRMARSATELKQVFSWLSIGPAASNFLGPFAAGLLIDHAGQTAGDLQGYRVAFFCLALLPLLSWWWVHAAREHPAKPSDQAHKRRAWDLLRAPQFRRLLIVNWLLSACWDVHTFVVPLLGHERDYSASVIGTLLGAFAVAASVIRVLLPLLAARLQEWRVVSGAMVVAALLFLVYPALPTAWSMGVCSVLLGFTLGTVQPMIMSMLHQITPHERHGEAIGLRLMAINASSVLMPSVFGLAGAAVGVSAVFWMVSASVGLGLPQALQLRRATAQPAAEPHDGDQRR